MASSKRTTSVERYSPITPKSAQDLAEMLSAASREFTIGRRRYHLGMTIPIAEPIGVLWLDEPQTKPGTHRIRGVLSPADFRLHSSSSDDGSQQIGFGSEIRFRLGRPRDLLVMYPDQDPETLDFGSYDFLSIEFSARHTVDGRPVVKRIISTDLDLSRIKAEAITLAGVDGIEVVTKTGSVSRRPEKYRALIAAEKDRLDANWKRPVWSSPETLRQAAEIFRREGGIDSAGQHGQVGRIYKVIADETGLTESVAKQSVMEARRQGLLPPIKTSKKEKKR